MNCFSQIKLILVLIHLKYRYYNTPSLYLPRPPHHFCLILPQKTEASLQKSSSCSFVVPYLVLPYSTKHYNQWLYKSIFQDRPSKSIITLYKNHITLGQRHIHQKAESIRAASLSKLDNIVNNNSIFNTKCCEFSTKWQGYL